VWALVRAELGKITLILLIPSANSFSGVALYDADVTASLVAGRGHHRFLAAAQFRRRGRVRGDLRARVLAGARQLPRVPDPGDRRRNIVPLTKAGERNCAGWKICSAHFHQRTSGY
jgi:hypothetical protein